MSKIKFYKDDGLTKQVSEIISFIKTNGIYNIMNALPKKFGIRFLGAGVNAYVFRLNSKKVIRIEFDPVRDSYFKWVKYCLKNQELKCIPKIYLACMIKGDNECLITVSELLIPLYGSKIFKSIVNLADIMNCFFNPNFKSHKNVFSEITKNIKPEYQHIIFPNEYTQIRKSMKDINDIHSKNIMLSPNKKRLVLTDPIHAC